MFERFTDRARRVLVLAQEEARLLHHGFIGSEHILLGLVGEQEGVAAQALRALDVKPQALRDEVAARVGQGHAAPDSPPFTPRAKKVLELSLREALQLGHSYIGDEHLLLGLIREGDGVGVQILVSQGVDLYWLRHTVLSLLGFAGDEPEQLGSELAPWSQSALAPMASMGGQAQIVRCSFCNLAQPEAGEMVGGANGAYICEHCIRHWHDELMAIRGQEPAAGDQEGAGEGPDRAAGPAVSPAAPTAAEPAPPPAGPGDQPGPAQGAGDWELDPGEDPLDDYDPFAGPIR